MSSNPFYASENNRHFSTNEQGYTALPVRSSIDSADGVHRPESNESNSLLNDDDDKFDITEEELNRPWKYKIFALVCALSLSVGSHYAAHTLGALKSKVKEELDITNSQYGIIQSSVSLVNTILPILGGVFIDTFGTSTGSILATSLIAVGNILVALSTNLASFPVMVFGRIFYGIGSGTIVTVQTTILSHWFKGKGLSIAVGVQIATSRLSSFLANLTVVRIANVTGFYEQEIQKLKQKKSFNPRKLLYLPTIYWIFVLLEFEFVTANASQGISDDEAASRSSLAQFLPIFIAPFLGYLLDRYGRRSATLIASAVFLTLSMFLIGFTMISSIIVMLLFSISLSLGPVSLLSSIPIILPLDYVGTGLGIIKSCSNIGSTLYDIIVGILQDIDGGEYRLVMHLYLVTSIIAVLVAVWLSFIASKWYDGIIDMKEDERSKYYEEIRAKRDQQGQERRNSYDGQDIHTKVTYPSRRNWAYVTTFVMFKPWFKATG
ncbi:13734_t:CDS:2 [Dentiscutata heterogama]|uniref:13734_t:CDS:1 n=1 Tax=Dentiscutata heterogama TaxID=1316150 RepID=A0ACA9K1J8_9GLOM|nr:13734_t:CDS:2 [Dentiscutata heterogama]